MTDIIQQAVAQHYMLEIRDLCKKTRKRHIIIARHLTYFLMKKHTKLSYASMGDLYSQDHATAINAVNRINGFLTYDKSLKKDL